VSSITEKGAWWTRIDLLVPFLGIFATVVYVLHGFEGELNRDRAIYSYAGQQVAEGVPPYLGILNRAGPLAHVIPGIGVAAARAGGFEDLLGIRLVFMLFAIASVCVVYLLARDLFSSRLAGLVAAMAFLSFYGFIEYATYGPREKTPMVFFLLFAFWALVKRRWFTAGICVSLAALIWQPSFLVGLTAAGFSLVGLRSGERLRSMGRFLLGGLIPAAVFVVYFIAVGALKEFFDAYLLINARYTTPAPLLDDWAKRWMLMHQGYGITLWVIVAGLAALPILTVALIVRGKWRAPEHISFVGFAAASFVGITWSFRDFNSWPDAFVLLPLAAVGVGGIAKEITARLPAKAALALVLVWMVAAGAVAVNYSITRRNYGLELERDSVTAMVDQFSFDPTMLAIGAPQPLVLSGIRNPTRHQTFARGLDQYVDDTWPGGLEGFGEWVGRQEPTIIALSRRVPKWLRPTIKSDYLNAGRGPSWTWYLHRSAVSDLRNGGTP
jgi:4-amino-4-deoxy-L-arabinose transferase-like glycosyltransferase